MTTPAFRRPSTGAVSVPFPDEAKLDGPAGEAAFARYIADCEEAARRETADEAVERCRAEADLLDHGGARFDDVFATLVESFDCHVRDLAGPDSEIEKGMSLDECSFYAGHQIDQLRQARLEMRDAFDSLDRERFRKAAATFAEAVADLGLGWMPRSPQKT